MKEFVVGVNPGHNQIWNDGSEVIWHFRTSAGSKEEAVRVVLRNPALAGMKAWAMPEEPVALPLTDRSNVGWNS